jgi:hypothetical protein
MEIRLAEDSGFYLFARVLWIWQIKPVCSLFVLVVVLNSRTLWVYPNGDTEESKGCVSVYLSNEVEKQERIYTFFKNQVCFAVWFSFLNLGWKRICQEIVLLFRSCKYWWIFKYSIWRHLFFFISKSWWRTDEVCFSLSLLLVSHRRGERRMIKNQLIDESTGFLTAKGELIIRLHLYTKSLVNIVNCW